MKTIKRILLLCLIVLVVIAGAQINGGYAKYKTALKNMPLDEVIADLQSKENYVQYMLCIEYMTYLFHEREGDRYAEF